MVPTDSDSRLAKLVQAYQLARDSRGLREPSIAELRRSLEGLFVTSGGLPRARRFLLQMLTELAAITGHVDGLLELVEEAVDAGLNDLAWIARLRLLDPLRGQPRFEALHERVRARAKLVESAWRAPDESLVEAVASLR